ncbi:MAG: M56 family metallopeptidase [Gemmatimonadota bacterium]|nr:M56 family metallopeptidase [Gemmatimonadota bacterium]
MISISVTQLVGIVLAGTLILAGALSVSWALRKQSAIARHAVWTGSFVVLLLLPAVATFAPPIDVPVLPRGWALTPPDAGGSAGAATQVGAERTIDGTAATWSLRPPAPAVSSGRPDTGSPTPGALEVLEGSGAALNLEPLPAGPVADVPQVGAVVPAAVWAIGILAALLSLAIGHLRLERLLRTATPVSSPRMRKQLDGAALRTGVGRAVAILTHPSVAVPMTAGLRRPVILLPPGAASWSAERLRTVFVHELAHVASRDALRHLVERVALAIYWFHPLAWIASRRAALTRELACDERVLATGTRASRYARCLLDLSHEAESTGSSSPALAMIQPSQLETRLMSILDPRRPGHSRALTGIAVIALASLGASAAVARPVAREAPDAVPQDRAAPVVPAEPSGSVAPVVPAEPSANVGPAVRAEPSAGPMPSVIAAPSVDVGPVALPEPAVVAVQEAACSVRGMSGSFVGNIRDSGDRREMSGRHNGDRIVQRYIDDLRICVRMHGDVELSDDLSRIESIGDADSWVVLESEEHALHRLLITRGSGGLDHVWSVDGESRPFDDDAAEWRDRMLRVLGGFSQAARLRGEQASLRGRIASYRGHVASMRGSIASERGKVASANGRVASARGRVASIRGQIASYRGQISRLESARQATSSENTRRDLDAEIDGLEQRIAELEATIEAHEADVRVTALEADIEEVDADVRIAEIEAELEAYDLDAKVAAVEREIEELDADRRAEAIEAALEPEVEALVRLIGRLR